MITYLVGMHLEKTINSLNVQKRHSESIFLLDSTIDESLILLGLTYTQINDVEKGVKYLLIAENLNPGSWVIPVNLCHMYNLLENYEISLKYAKKAIKLGNKEPDPYYNQGVVLGNLGRFPESIESYKKALELSPNNPNIQHNLSHMFLMLGDYKNGWPLYEMRLKACEQTRNFVARFKQPLWNGENIKNKTILVFSEQGIGDLIQFSRYIPDLKKKGAKVWLECQEITSKLFVADKIIPRDEINWIDPPMTDYAVSVCSLPYLLGYIKKSSHIKYSSKIKIKPTKKFKIGLCWAGNANHPQDSYRTCPAKFLQPLVEAFPNIQFYSFQKDKNNIRNWKGKITDISYNLDIIDLDIKDFDDTACLIKQMDLIITVDTSLAHLAGSLDCPTIILLSAISDWRWLTNTNKTEWYPSIKIMRQETCGEWEFLIEKVIQEVHNRLELKNNLQSNKKGSKR